MFPWDKRNVQLQIRTLPATDPLWSGAQRLQPLFRGRKRADCQSILTERAVEATDLNPSSLDLRPVQLVIQFRTDNSRKQRDDHAHDHHFDAGHTASGFGFWRP